MRCVPGTNVAEETGDSDPNPTETGFADLAGSYAAMPAGPVASSSLPSDDQVRWSGPIPGEVAQGACPGSTFAPTIRPELSTCAASSGTETSCEARLARARESGSQANGAG